MKKETLQKRIEKNLTTKAGTVSVKFAEVIKLINNPETTLYPVQWHRNGRHMSISDHTANIVEGLHLLGIDFEQGNDAPRGGRNGEFIRLTAKGKQQVKDYAESK